MYIVQIDIKQPVCLHKIAIFANEVAQEALSRVSCTLVCRYNEMSHELMLRKIDVNLLLNWA